MIDHQGSVAAIRVVVYSLNAVLSSQLWPCYCCCVWVWWCWQCS